MSAPVKLVSLLLGLAILIAGGSLLHKQREARGESTRTDAAGASLGTMEDGAAAPVGTVAEGTRISVGTMTDGAEGSVGTLAETTRASVGTLAEGVEASVGTMEVPPSWMGNSEQGGEEMMAGEELLGKPLASLDGLRWPGGDQHDISRAPLTLLRWWTDECPHCAASLPALDQLQQKYADQGLAFVAVYHPKPPRDVEDGQVQRIARRLGVRGQLAIDESWDVLKRVWLSGGRRPATSVTFLVDRRGIVRFVHPGPRIFWSTDPSDAEADASMRRLEDVARTLLQDSQE